MSAKLAEEPQAGGKAEVSRTVLAALDAEASGGTHSFRHRDTDTDTQVCVPWAAEHTPIFPALLAEKAWEAQRPSSRGHTSDN